MISVKREPRRGKGLTLAIEDKTYEVRIVRLRVAYVLTELASGAQYSLRSGDPDGEQSPHCTCPGFEHRGTCKHLDSLQEVGLIS